MSNEFYFNASDIGFGSEIQADLDLLGGVAARVLVRAQKKVAKWLRVHAVREIGKELSISQKSLKRRFSIRERTVGDERQVLLWFGLLGISAIHLGDSRQIKKGTRVGRRMYEGAFLARLKNGGDAVFVRSARNASAGNEVIGRPITSAGDSRYPIERVGLNIEEPAKRVLVRYEQRVNRQYQKILKQELNYELRKLTASKTQPIP